MKDPSDQLISALYTAMNANVTYASVDVPVYTKPVEWGDRPSDQYIRIGEVRWGEVGPKDGSVCDGSIDVLVDTFFTGKSEGSKKVMNNIANQVSQLIDQSFSLADFTQVMGRVSAMEDLDYDLDDQGTAFEKLITYSFITEEV